MNWLHKTSAITLRRSGDIDPGDCSFRVTQGRFSDDCSDSFEMINYRFGTWDMICFKLQSSIKLTYFTRVFILLSPRWFFYFSWSYWSNTGCTLNSHFCLKLLISVPSTNPISQLNLQCLAHFFFPLASVLSQTRRPLVLVQRAMSYHQMPHYFTGCEERWKQKGLKHSQQLAWERPWFGCFGPLLNTACLKLEEKSRWEGERSLKVLWIR